MKIMLKVIVLDQEPAYYF